MSAAKMAQITSENFFTLLLASPAAMTGVLTILGCGGSAGVPKIGNGGGLGDPAEPKQPHSCERYG